MSGSEMEIGKSVNSRLTEKCWSKGSRKGKK